MSDARLELVEAAAFTALWGAAPEPRPVRHGVRAHTVAGAVCTAVAAAPENTMINRVTRLGLREPPTDAELDEIDSFFRHAEAASASRSSTCGRTTYRRWGP